MERKPTRNDLTEQQQAALRFIAGYLRDNRIAPTIAEVAEELGTHFASAYYQVNALERKGYVRRTPSAHRRMEIVRQPDTEPGANPG